MNPALKELLMDLLRKRVIGAKHTPEDRIIKVNTRWLQRPQRKEFRKEYGQLVREELILRSKKMTGKSADWHISLNPRKLKEVEEMIG